MSENNAPISRRLLQGVAVMCLLSVSQQGFSNTLSQVLAVRVWSSSKYTRVTLESNHMLQYKQFLLKNPERMVIDIKSINLNTVLKEINRQIHANDFYIESARVSQFNPQTVRIVFQLKQSIKLQLFALGPVAGFKERLVMDFYPSNVTNIQDPLLTLLKDCNQSNFKKRISLIRNRSKIVGKAGINRPIIIMLDPGHGGEDSGAIGKYHTREKDVVLQIARRLKSLIERESNMCVYMTRNEDIFIPLKVRVAKAQKQGADLFISIHADSFNGRQPSGSSVFALATKVASNTASRYLMDTQNTPDLIGGISKVRDHYIDRAMFEMVQTLTIIDSLKFGQAVLGKLASINKLHKKKVEQAGFAVLKAPNIPSILVETGFISNVEEEQKLKTAKFQQEVAKSIFAGIKIYFSDRLILARNS